VDGTDDGSIFMSSPRRGKLPPPIKVPRLRTHGVRVEGNVPRSTTSESSISDLRQPPVRTTWQRSGSLPTNILAPPPAPLDRPETLKGLHQPIQGEATEELSTSPVRVTRSNYPLLRPLSISRHSRSLSSLSSARSERVLSSAGSPPASGVSSDEPSAAIVRMAERRSAALAPGTTLGRDAGNAPRLISLGRPTQALSTTDAAAAQTANPSASLVLPMIAIPQLSDAIRQTSDSHSTVSTDTLSQAPPTSDVELMESSGSTSMPETPRSRRFSGTSQFTSRSRYDSGASFDVRNLPFMRLSTGADLMPNIAIPQLPYLPALSHSSTLQPCSPGQLELLASDTTQTQASHSMNSSGPTDLPFTAGPARRSRSADSLPNLYSVPSSRSSVGTIRPERAPGRSNSVELDALLKMLTSVESGSESDRPFSVMSFVQEPATPRPFPWHGITIEQAKAVFPPAELHEFAGKGLALIGGDVHRFVVNDVDTLTGEFRKCEERAAKLHGE
jgi:hypothetical protein